MPPSHSCPAPWHTCLCPPRPQELLSAGANPGATDTVGENALHDLVRCFEPAKEVQYLAAARALLHGGCSATLPSNEGTTPLVSGHLAPLPRALMLHAACYVHRPSPFIHLPWQLASMGAATVCGRALAVHQGSQLSLLYPRVPRAEHGTGHDHALHDLHWLPVLQAMAVSKGYFQLEQLLREARDEGQGLPENARGESMPWPRQKAFPAAASLQAGLA